MVRFSHSQTDRTLIHERLPQPSSNHHAATEITQHSTTHRFVVCSDSQIGMSSGNREWESELEYSRRAIRLINQMDPRPLFCCCCGDLVDMEHTFFTGKGFSKEECDTIQDQQNSDFKKTWSELHEDIAVSTPEYE
jgi:hypothetical protein